MLCERLEVRPPGDEVAAHRRPRRMNDARLAARGVPRMALQCGPGLEHLGKAARALSCVELGFPSGIIR